jgi:hypothetical protein
VDLAPLEGLVGRQRITLEHSEFAYRRGGLIGRYYRKPDFSELIVERVDPFVYFFDDREQFTPAVYGAHSAVWSGGLYVAEAGKFDLELAAWQRAPARGKVAIDGKTIFELKPETMGAIGYVKGQVELADGLRDIRLEFSDPTDRSWSFALFVWRKGKRGEDLREVFCPKELYYVESVGTTHYRWDDTPFQVYAVPLVTPPGKHALHFYTKDMAGNVEKTQTREFAVGLMSERDR